MSGNQGGDGGRLPGSSKDERNLLNNVFDKVKKSRETDYKMRDYQAFLYEEALKGNIIVCLPTGSGKSFIAVQLIKHYLPKAAQTNKKIIFVASTVPLVHQQGDYINSHIIKTIENERSPVVTFTGDRAPDFWDKEEWESVLDSYKVLVITDAILKDAIEKGRIGFENICLLIFDECHNAVKNHPMSIITQEYTSRVKRGGIVDVDVPKILGLTATIIKHNSNKGSILEDVQAIQNRFHARAITYSDYEEVLKCSTSAMTDIISCPKYSFVEEIKTLVNFIREKCIMLRSAEFGRVVVVEENSAIVENVNHSSLVSENQIMGKKSSTRKNCARLLTELTDIIQDMGPYCFKYAVVLGMGVVEKMKRSKHTKGLAPLKKENALRILNYTQHQLVVLLDAIERLMVSQSHLQPVLHLVSPKLRKLQELLRGAGVTQDQTKVPFCGITFCETRLSTQILAFYLKDLAKCSPLDYGYLRTDFVVGSSSGNPSESKSSLATQKRILKEFRERELNLLVATTVLEEGLNVPECNFILRFDLVKTYPSFIQSMGRARQRNAKFYVLCSEEDEEGQRQKLKGFQEYGEELSKCLQANALHAESELSCDLEVEESELNRLIPPFLTGNGTQKITALSAVSTVYSYCQSLVNDKLSVLTPKVWWVLVGDMYRVYVRLPPNSAVKEAQSDLFKSKHVARKSAFMAVCVKLWYAGVLDPVSLEPFPRRRNNFKCDFLEERESADPLVAVGEKKVGSKNRFNWVKKYVPQKLQSAELRGCIQIPLNLFAIEITIEDTTYFGKPELFKVYEFHKYEHLMGILTAVDLSQAKQQILLSRDGNFKVTLKHIASNIILSKSDYEKWMKFQQFVFSDLLKISHLIFPSDEGCQMTPWLFVALRKTDRNDIFSSQLNPNIISDLLMTREIDYKKQLTEEFRRSLAVDSAMYNDKVVIPWYSNTYESQMYCVLGVLTDQNPTSSFDSSDPGKGATFEEYYKKKYEVVIVNKSQPLLEAKALSQQLNLLAAKHNDAMASKTNRKDARYSSSAIKLIPELVRIHPIPASLLVQIKFLPSCIHRITRLLVADELRKAVNVHCGNLWKDDDLTVETSAHLEHFSQLKIQMAGEIGVYAGCKELQQANALESNGIVEMQLPRATLKRVDEESQKGGIDQLLWAELEHQHPFDLCWNVIEETLEATEDPNASPKRKRTVDDLVPSSPISADPCLIPLEDVPRYDFNRRCNFYEEKGPLPFHIMEAITLANANDAVSLEKMELIGDSVLKFVTTTHIVSEFRDWDEGKMTCLKNRLISNRHLCGVGRSQNLESILAGSIFEGSCWLPPGVTIPERFTKPVVDNGTTYSVYKGIAHEKPTLDLKTQTNEQLGNLISDFLKRDSITLQTYGPTNHSHTHANIGDKSVADCVEALIGAYYLNGGLDSALKFMSWVGLKGPTTDPKRAVPYNHFLDNDWILPEYPDSRCPSLKDYLPYLKQLEDRIGYEFQQPWLLVEAFTHPTYSQSCVTSSYERLEFLGDAILDFLITHHIYATKLAETPGKLTDLRSALVNNVTFGSLAVKFELHSQLLSFSPQLDELIDQFSSHQKQNGHQIVGQFSERLVTDFDCLVAQDIEVPKVLGDIWESLAGAIYLDSKYDLDKVWSVFYRLMKEEIDCFSKNIPLSPVREIMEKFPSKAKFIPVNDGISEDGVLKVVKLEIEMFQPFYGCGTSKSNAKVAAAKFALKTISAKTSGEMEKAKSYIRYNEWEFKTQGAADPVIP